MALRLRLHGGEWAGVLALAARLRLLPALAAAVEAKGLTAGIPAFHSPSGEATPAAVLADASAEHERRRAIFQERLSELLDAFARADIRPVLLKGATALWTGIPAWRSLRDIDLLVAPPTTSGAVGVAISAGYRPNQAFSAPEGWHHGAELYRDDLPGWVEIHERGGVRRIEAILPTSTLMQAARPITDAKGRTALVLPAPLHILYCAAHHHVGHRGDYYGVIDFKGLYEFAADVDALEEAGRQELLLAASQHPRLTVMLDLWLAAAADVFALPVRAPLQVPGDARRRWSVMRTRASREAHAARFAGLAEEVSMAFEGNRLGRQPRGRTALGRMILRYQAIRAMATRAAGA